jgi:hypothetical protein
MILLSLCVHRALCGCLPSASFYCHDLAADDFVIPLPLCAFALTSPPHKPEKYSVDFQRLTQIRKNIFQPPPPL